MCPFRLSRKAILSLAGSTALAALVFGFSAHALAQDAVLGSVQLRAATRQVRQLPPPVEGLQTRMMSPGSAGYPAPDDNGPWGPIGPVIREKAKFMGLQKQRMSGLGSSFGYPSPDDNGPWGPIGPVIRDRAKFPGLQKQRMSGLGSSFGYPSPDDNGPWGPIGPVIREKAKSLEPALQTEPDPTPWMPAFRGIGRLLRQQGPAGSMR